MFVIVVVVVVQVSVVVIVWCPRESFNVGKLMELLFLERLIDAIGVAD